MFRSGDDYAEFNHQADDAAISIFFLVILCIAWILPGLIGHDPWKPDEAYTFGLVNHILKTGDWVVPTLAGEPFVEKPPLYYFTAAIFAKILSSWMPIHDGARLASGFYMGLTLIFAGFAGRELWGRGHGRLTVLILIGCLGLLIRSHQMITDVALLFGFALALYGLILATRRGFLGGVALGTGVGVGFMSKGLIEPGIIGIIALLMPIFSSRWRNKNYFIALITAFFAVLPWLIIWPYALYRHSPALFNEWFWMQNFGRFMGYVRLGPLQESWYYLKILPWFAWPALPLALWTLWRHKLGGLTHPAIQFTVITFLVMLGVLSFSVDGRDVYALPLLLPLSLLGAAAIGTLRRGAARALDWFALMTFGLFTVILWVAYSALMLGHPQRLAQRLEYLQPGFVAEFEPVGFSIALIFTLIWLASLIIFKRTNQRAVINWALGITLVWGILTTMWLPYLDGAKSYRAMIKQMQVALPANYRCIASVDLGEPQRALLDYFAGIVTQRVESHAGAASCDLLLMQGSTREEAEDPGAKWRRIWEGSRPGDRVERYRLYQWVG